MYTPRDVARFILRKEEDIIALLEKEKIGKKICGFWYVKGKQIIEIQKKLKGEKKC